MIEKYFVPFDRAVKLKDLGFDEDCFRMWVGENTLRHENSKNSQILHSNNVCSAPLFSQAFSFFREKFELISTVHPYQELTSFEWYYNFSIVGYAKNTIYGDLRKLSYKEAELACLDKLIEVCEEYSVS